MDGGAQSGDEGRLWMTEDGGYMCVDLLLERTLEELAEGLAFAARLACMSVGVYVCLCVFKQQFTSRRVHREALDLYLAF